MKKEFIKRYGWTLLGIVAGMGGGYLYWLHHWDLPYHFFSCQQFHLGGGNGGIVAQFIYAGA